MPIVPVSTERFDWQCGQHDTDLLTRPDAPDWAALAQHPHAKRIKHNALREIWRVRIGQRNVYAKLYRPCRLTAILRRRPSQDEWRVICYAHQMGLPVPAHIAVGRARHRTDCDVLLTEAVDDGCDVKRVWHGIQQCANPCERYRRSRALADALAEMLARAHQAGFWHKDLHPGNLLVRDTDQTRPTVVMLDLQSAVIGRPVRDTAAIRNLVHLAQWFTDRATRTDRLAMLTSYLTWRQRLTDAPFARTTALTRRQIVRQADRLARRHAHSLWAKRDRAASGTGRAFATLRLPNRWRAIVSRVERRPAQGLHVSGASLSRDTWRHLLADPAALLTTDPTRLLKGSQTGDICRTELTWPDGTLPAICKRPTPRNVLKKLLYPITQPRTRMAWRKGYALLNRDIPTARPLAMLERRTAGLLCDSILLTEAITDSHDLDTMLRLHLASLPAPAHQRVKRQLIERLAHVIRRMHERGFVHRDLKASNILVQWTPQTTDPPGVALIDLDGLKHRWLNRPAPQRLAIRAIARLNVSLDRCTTVTRTDRMRFVQAYARRPGWTRDQCLALWRSIQTVADRNQNRWGVRSRWELDLGDLA